jgi:predicted transcriptional regulator
MLRTEYENTNNNNDNNTKMSLADFIKAISDDKSLSIFKLIADANFNGEISLKKLGLSTKQFYSRISQMMVVTGLIKRQSRKYYLTSFGKVIYCSRLTYYSSLRQ